MAKRNLRESMSLVLTEKVTEAEQQFLNEMGFTMKKPNKYTVIAAALYKKAAAGDLSAIKELRALVGEYGLEQREIGVVKIIDDIGY